MEFVNTTNFIVILLNNALFSLDNVGRTLKCGDPHFNVTESNFTSSQLKNVIEKGNLVTNCKIDHSSYFVIFRSK